MALLAPTHVRQPFWIVSRFSHRVRAERGDGHRRESEFVVGIRQLFTKGTPLSRHSQGHRYALALKTKLEAREIPVASTVAGNDFRGLVLGLAFLVIQHPVDGALGRLTEVSGDAS